MGYPLSAVLGLLLVAYSLIILIVVFLWRKSRGFNINRVTDTINFTLCGIMTVCAWFFQQSTYIDLDHMMQEIDIARTQGMNILFVDAGNQPVAFLLLLVGYWTGDRRILQVIGCGITYGLLMLIVAKLKHLLNPDPVSALLGTLLALISPQYVTAVTNIRFIIAAEMLVLAFLMWSVERRCAVAIALTIVALSLHSGTLAIFCCAMIALIKSASLFYLLCGLFACYSLFLNKLVNFLTSSSLPVLRFIGSKAAMYYGIGIGQHEYDSEMIAAGGITVGARFLCVVILLLFIYFIARGTLLVTLPVPIEKFFIAEIIFTVSSSQSFTVFSRYMYLATFFVIPLLFCCLNNFFTSTPVRASGRQCQGTGEKNYSLQAFLKVSFLCLVMLLVYLDLGQWSTYYSSMIVF